MLEILNLMVDQGLGNLRELFHLFWTAVLSLLDVKNIFENYSNVGMMLTLMTLISHMAGHKILSHSEPDIFCLPFISFLLIWLSNAFP